MNRERLIITGVERPALSDVTALQRFTVAEIADALGHEHLVDGGPTAVTPGRLVCGPAVTCLGVDVLVRRAAIDLAEPGDVLVVAAGGSAHLACFGGAVAAHMQSQGMAGAVVDGAVRDVAELRRRGFATWARGVTPAHIAYPTGRDHGAVNVTVEIANHLIDPGDLVVADDDGIVVVPREKVPDLVDDVVTQVAEHDTTWARRRGSRFGAVAELVTAGYRVLGSPGGPERGVGGSREV